MAIDSTQAPWFTAWAWWGALVLTSFLVLETTAIVTHGWTLSNTIISYTRTNIWTLWVYLAAVFVFAFHIWYFAGK